MPKASPFSKPKAALRKAALAQSAFKVRVKVFLFMSEAEGCLRLSMKLPDA